MDVQYHRSACAAPAPVLLVMLPGAYSRPAEFVDEGFVGAVRARGLAVDIAVADAHLGYFNDGSVMRRLRDDVLLPARAQGYRQVWLVGISLGGFAAFGYASLHPGEVDGIVALAPYLGRRGLQREIDAAGGPAGWAAQPHPPTGDKAEDAERALWQWLASPAALAAAPPIYLGFGRDDRFVDAHRTLAPLLPAGRSFDAPGGHDWPAWRALWAAWLDRGLLPTACASAAP